VTGSIKPVQKHNLGACPIKLSRGTFGYTPTQNWFSQRRGQSASGRGPAVPVSAFVNGKDPVNRPRKDWKPGERSLKTSAKDSGVYEM
jgi:hypothetical protein